MIKKYLEYIKEEGESCGDGGGGVAYVNAGTTTGMGNVVPAIPSQFAGDVSGSTIGSGDVSKGFINNTPANKPNKTKKKKNRKKSSTVLSYTDYINNLAK